MYMYVCMGMHACVCVRVRLPVGHIRGGGRCAGLFFPQIGRWVSYAIITNNNVTVISSRPRPGWPRARLPEFSHKAEGATDRREFGFFLLLEAAMLCSIPSQQDQRMIALHASPCQMNEIYLSL